MAAIDLRIVVAPLAGTSIEIPGLPHEQTTVTTYEQMLDFQEDDFLDYAVHGEDGTRTEAPAPAPARRRPARRAQHHRQHREIETASRTHDDEVSIVFVVVPTPAIDPNGKGRCRCFRTWPTCSSASGWCAI